MRALKFWLFGLLFASSGVFALSGNTVATENVKARLVSEVTAIGPGQSFWVALELDIREGWHTYWRNPGDSGEPTKLAWQLPPGFTAGDIVWTTPHRFEIAPLVNYGYAKHAVHLVQITAPKDLKAGTPVSLAAKASWLVCSDVCIPEDANLQLALPVSARAGAVDATAAALFTTARSELPTAQPAPTSARIAGGKLIVTLGQEWGATLSQITSLAFFPYDEGGIEYATPQTLTRTKDAVDLAMKVGYQPPKAGAIRGVLVVTEQNGTQTDTVPIEIAANFSGAGAAQVKAGPRLEPLAQAKPPAQSNKEPEHSLPTLLLFAVLGGLILNLMPCVFPVLSIKALNVMEQAKKHPAEVRAKGLVFAATPASDFICGTQQLASMNMHLFTTGEGTPYGLSLVPVIKISSRTALARKKRSSPKLRPLSFNLPQNLFPRSRQPPATRLTPPRAGD